MISTKAKKTASIVFRAELTVDGRAGWFVFYPLHAAAQAARPRDADAVSWETPRPRPSVDCLTTVQSFRAGSTNAEW